MGSRGLSPRNTAPPQAPSAAVHRGHPATHPAPDQGCPCTKAALAWDQAALLAGYGKMNPGRRAACGQQVGKGSPWLGADSDPGWAQPALPGRAARHLGPESPPCVRPAGQESSGAQLGQAPKRVAWLQGTGGEPGLRPILWAGEITHPAARELMTQPTRQGGTSS